MDSINPATGEVIETYDDHTADDVDSILDESAAVTSDWAETPITDRQQLLERAADVLRDNEDEYAELITHEMGKPISESRAEVEKCAWVCEYYAERAGEFLADRVIGSEPNARTFVSYEPLGAVLAVMPWNFPFWQVFRFAAPHLTAGNVGLLKHASNVPGCALAIEDVFREAGYPEGVFSTLLVDSEKMEDVIRDDRLDALTLTGSEGAGRTVAEQAGNELKKHVLELGGSDPFVVCEDADLDAAAETGVAARTINSGQSCIAAKRFIVVDAVYEDFLDQFVQEMEALEVGDPTDSDTEVGPQAREDLVEDLHEQVEASVDAGADLACGGGPMDREGWYYPPTVLAEPPMDSPAATEEVFGPVAAVFRAEDEADAIEMANDTHYGLGASIWTADLERGEGLAREIDAGCVFVNELVKSDPRVPFGGVKASGYGRELGKEGIHEFVNRKTVWVQSPGDEDDAVPTE
ncbi:NAD-dependent succinate-semialdehyde dehydrogenase [Natronosalvus rutilus]|uniref:NAD-dependent succinate-semialdehyde dehydrogenase n=1 Tax=Natronosalvus rutilus TaxID=2953753 RepID=A0A9E7NDB3_9EURY|nr:NAD-dependent succinate-semialdehyde dehydrogenase [Natronosalvus rutilus]UTF54923.1 NAD-dependent succinate-semialdehyde dehydrogenase [Natronosalvus rutilus]